MLMQKTAYTIQPLGNTLAVLENGVIEAYGFVDNESALKAVHVIEGSVKRDFYTQSKGIVYLNRELEKVEP